METRVKSLEAGFRTLEEKVTKLQETLHTALLGTLDGKPGMMQTLHNSLEASRVNSVKLDDLAAAFRTHTAQLDALRLDRAKVTGIVLAVSVLWGAFGVLLKYGIK